MKKKHTSMAGYKDKGKVQEVDVAKNTQTIKIKMPNGKENIRTHNLGNSAPKLLKFKAEGVNNDN